MRERIEAGQPLPLYHQVAEAIRYRIATGELRPGMRLPSLRRAAEVWRVNLHTVRRAYGVLEDQGIVATRDRSSTVVLGGKERGGLAGNGAGTVQEFVAGVLREAEDRWRLSADQLIPLLRDAAAGRGGMDPTVHVVECSEIQSGYLAAQLGSRYRVRAMPWSLEREGDPGEGLILATYFHYNDVRCRWPLREVRFSATRPDPALRSLLLHWAKGMGRETPLEVVLCERELPMARNIMADLVRSLPPEEFTLSHAVEAPERLLGAATGAVLFAPRVWGEMSEELRAHPHALEVRYVFETKDLTRIAGELDWSRAR